MNLRIPGPTPCPPETLAEMSGQMINHRGPEFAELQNRIMKRLKQFFGTESDVYILTASGTGAMECAVVNTLSAGDHALVVSIGEFGERFNLICQTYGVKVTKLGYPHGEVAKAQEVADAVAKDPSLNAVLVTHNETSTGVTNDVGAIARAVRAVRPDILLIVDAISSLGCVPFKADAWDVDVCATASQKGFMVPPGLAFVTFRDRAWKAYERCTTPKFYFDIGKAKSFAERGQTPWTPAVSLYYALDLALDIMEKEGLEQIHARHADIGEYTRGLLKGLGLKLLAEGPQASNTVTSVIVPEGVDGSKLLGLLRTQYKTVLAGGQGPLAGKIVRIGHLGYVDREAVKDAVDALAAALQELGYKTPAAQKA